jgi:hypothetical protein
MDSDDEEEEEEPQVEDMSSQSHHHVAMSVPPIAMLVKIVQPAQMSTKILMVPEALATVRTS